MLMSAPLVIDASAAHTASLIFLHGLGDTGYGWAPVMRQIARKFCFMKFILPHAPQRPVTLNYGMKMPAWYDIYTLSESDEREDEKGLHESTSTLMDLVKKEESAGISPERIFIGGGAVSIFTALTVPDLKVGGIISLSAYVPARKYIRSLPPRHLTTPMFMAHGTADMVIQYRWHQHSLSYLKGLPGANITVKVYEGMQHSSCEEEVADIIEYIETQLKSSHAETKTDL